jgi:hypothetical protein
VRAFEPAGRVTTIVLPARPAPVAACLSAPEVRRALWRIYLPGFRRYMSDAAGDARWQRLDLERVPVCEWTVMADAVTAALLLRACGVTPSPGCALLFETLIGGALEAADPQLTMRALLAAAMGRDRRARQLFGRLATMTCGCTSTMDLGWMLAAVCRYEMTAGENGRVARCAGELAGRLLANQDPSSGLFFAEDGSDGLLPAHSDATLASQASAIAGLAAFAEVSGDREIAERAARCADRLCLMQGSQGQWWSRYDVPDGVVAERYPVCVRHQDGTMPAALGALQRALGERRYDRAVAKGLEWAGGGNEAGECLIDERRGTVSGAIGRLGSTCDVHREMDVRQPACFVMATLSDPLWSAQVAV